MKITSENRLGSAWVDEINSLRMRNVKIIIRNVFLAVFMVCLFLAGLLSGSILFFIISMLIILGIFIYLIFFASTILTLEFSEILAYFLFGVFVRLEKYDGKKDYLAKEGIKLIKKIRKVLDEYTDRSTYHYLFFDFEKVSDNLEKFRDNLSKVDTLFKYYKPNEEYKNNLQKTLLTICFELHTDKKITKKVQKSFDELNEIPIKKVEVKYERWNAFLELIGDNFKKYLKLAIFSLVVVFVVWWIIPYFFPGILASGDKLMLIIPIIGAATAVTLFNRN